jgi:5-formyltetrahydrofolate cyclo-ligase
MRSVNAALKETIIDMLLTKDDIRRGIRKKRRELDPAAAGAASLAAEKALVALPEFAGVSVVCCYCALPGEVDTNWIIEHCWNHAVQICVPAYRSESGDYGVARLDRTSRLVQGKFGVMEPAEKHWIEVAGVDLIAVPGLAFDKHGGRVGHGGGHYDRIMRGDEPMAESVRMREGGQKRLLKAGLGFDWQVFDLVPMNSDDVRLDVIVTDKRVLRPAGA